MKGRGMPGKDKQLAYNIYQRYRQHLGALENRKLGRLYESFVKENGQPAYMAAYLAYRRAVEQNDDYAHIHLANLLVRAPKPIKQDLAEAWRLLNLAAEKGIARAQACVGAMHERGLGAAKDVGLAIHWYELAAAQDDMRAHARLGHIYKNLPADGAAVEEYKRKAYNHFSAAYRMGDLNSGYELGLIMRDRNNQQEFLNYLRAVALRDHRPAQIELCRFYDTVDARQNIRESLLEVTRWGLRAGSVSQRLNAILICNTAEPRHAQPLLMHPQNNALMALLTYSGKFGYLSEEVSDVSIEDSVCPALQPSLSQMRNYVDRLCALARDLESKPILGTVFEATPICRELLNDPQIQQVGAPFYHEYDHGGVRRFLTMGETNVKLVKDISQVLSKSKPEELVDDTQAQIANTMIAHWFWKAFKAKGDVLACDILSPLIHRSYELHNMASFGNVLSFLDLLSSCYVRTNSLLEGNKAESVRTYLSACNHAVSDKDWNDLVQKVMTLSTEDKTLLLPSYNNPDQQPSLSISDIAQRAYNEVEQKLLNVGGRNQAIVELPITQPIASSLGVRRDLGLEDPR